MYRLLGRKGHVVNFLKCNQPTGGVGGGDVELGEKSSGARREEASRREGGASERAKDTSGKFLHAICRTPRHDQPIRVSANAAMPSSVGAET